MPDHEKPAFAYHDYNSGGSYHAQAAEYGPSHYVSQRAFSTGGGSHGHPGESSDLASTPTHSSLSYTQREDSPCSPYSNQVLGVKFCGPSDGSEGTKVQVHLSSSYDISTFAGHSISVVFGPARCKTDIRPAGFHNQNFYYELTAEAPALALTGWTDAQGSILLRVEDEAGAILQSVELGHFTYLDAFQQSPAFSARGATRKRKTSQEPEPQELASKKTSARHLRAESGDDVPAFSYTPVTGSPYSPYAQPVPSTDLYALPSSWDRPQPPLALQRTLQRSVSYPYNGPSLAGQQPFAAQSPQPQSWNAAVGPMSSHASRNRSVLAEHTPPPRSGQALGSPSGQAHPPLIRTSTMQQPSSAGSSTSVPQQLGQAFNPYAMYPSKAILKLQGELDDMADNWTGEERTLRRRLVQFQRRQDGSTIHATFQPVPQTERPPNGIVISCILWEEKDECYVTSVDTIYLLESLVAVRFTVEEKNRIRRNLEGFRPLTVSKAKSDSEEFFKVIMGFGNPKPRNIEKDVKVFPWSVLAHALKKIIGKYSASYSSTAGALSTPLSAPGSLGPTSVTDFAEANSSYSHLSSPSSTSEPLPPSSSALGITSAGFPAHVQGPGLHGHGGQPDLHVMTSQWVPVQRRAHSMQAQYGRPPNDGDGWGLTAYLDANTATTSAAIDPHTMAYAHHMGISPGHNSQMLTPVSGTSQRGSHTPRQ